MHMHIRTHRPIYIYITHTQYVDMSFLTEVLIEAYITTINPSNLWYCRRSRYLQFLRTLLNTCLLSFVHCMMLLFSSLLLLSLLAVIRVKVMEVPQVSWASGPWGWGVDGVQFWASAVLSNRGSDPATYFGCFNTAAVIRDRTCHSRTDLAAVTFKHIPAPWV